MNPVCLSVPQEDWLVILLWPTTSIAKPRFPRPSHHHLRSDCCNKSCTYQHSWRFCIPHQWVSDRVAAATNPLPVPWPGFGARQSSEGVGTRVLEDSGRQPEGVLGRWRKPAPAASMLTCGHGEDRADLKAPGSCHRDTQAECRKWQLVPLSFLRGSTGGENDSKMLQLTFQVELEKNSFNTRLLGIKTVYSFFLFPFFLACVRISMLEITWRQRSNPELAQGIWS